MTHYVSAVKVKAFQEVLLKYISRLNVLFGSQNVRYSPFHLTVPVFPCLHIFLISLYGYMMYIDCLQL
jgi:hypothetical protein